MCIVLSVRKFNVVLRAVNVDCVILSDRNYVSIDVDVTFLTLLIYYLVSCSI